MPTLCGLFYLVHKMFITVTSKYNPNIKSSVNVEQIHRIVDDDRNGTLVCTSKYEITVAESRQEILDLIHYMKKTEVTK